MRLNVFAAVVAGTLVMASSVAFHARTLSIAAYVVCTGVIILLGIGVERRLRRTPSVQRHVPFAPRLPTIMSIVAFIGYALVLAAVHTHELSRLDNIAARADIRATAANEASVMANRAASGDTARGIAQLKRALRHLTPKQRAALGLELRARDKQLGRTLRQGDIFAASGILARVLPGTPRAVRQLVKTLQKAGSADRAATAAYAAARRARAGKTPVLSALPRWFARLGNFFPLAAQILAGLIIALAIARRSLADSVAEQHLRIATRFAMLGIGAALIGSLPELHRGFQAFLLGYVCAGFASVLTTLGLVGSGAFEFDSTPRG